MSLTLRLSRLEEQEDWEWGSRPPSRFVGKSVRINHGRLTGRMFSVEDWASRVLEDWTTHNLKNNAVFMYFLRKETDDLPSDDSVLYGKIGAWPYCVHLSEIS